MSWNLWEQQQFPWNVFQCCQRCLRLPFQWPYSPYPKGPYWHCVRGCYPKLRRTDFSDEWICWDPVLPRQEWLSSHGSFCRSLTISHQASFPIGFRQLSYTHLWFRAGCFSESQCYCFVLRNKELSHSRSFRAINALTVQALFHSFHQQFDFSRVVSSCFNHR